MPLDAQKVVSWKIPEGGKEGEDTISDVGGYRLQHAPKRGTKKKG